MGQGLNVSEEYSVERNSVLDSPVKPLFSRAIVSGQGLHVEWEVREMVLTHQKMGRLWQMLQQYPTLFSDFTRNKPSAWITQVTSPDTYWLEIYENKNLVGLIYFEGMLARRDIDAHMVYFDRKPAAKVAISRDVIEYMFKTFPIRSIVVTPPVIYHATLRMLTKLGFHREGFIRGAVPLGGRLCDQVIYRITRSAVCPS